MSLRNINIVISREYKARVKTRSFLVLTLVTPVIFALLIILPVWVLSSSKDREQTIEVVDESGIVLPYLTDGKAAHYVDCTGSDLDSLKLSMKEDGADAVLHITAFDDETRTVGVEVFSLKPLTIDVKGSIQSRVEEAVEDYRIASYEIPELKEIVENLKPDIHVTTYTVEDDGKENVTTSEVFMVISVVLAMLIYMFVFMFAAMVMQSVVEEKTTRVAEVLVSSVKATDLMLGKIIGVAGVALTQFIIWLALVVVIVGGVASSGVFAGIAGTEGMEQISSITGGVDISSMTGVDVSALAGAVADATLSESEASAVGSNSVLNEVIATLRNLNYWEILLSFFAYFLLGYLLYASFLAAVSSAVDNEANANQLQWPVTVLLFTALFISIQAYNYPDSALVLWGSMIPFTSPVVMMARIPFGVPTWQLILSLVLLLLTFILFAWLAARIYRVGLLTSGKKITYSDILKWLKMK